MGRTRTFDERDVVRAARGVFWANGYADTAIPQLERATGLHRSSIYHGFGSKRGLFDAAVASYLSEVVRPLIAPLQAAEVSPTALLDYLRALRAAMASPAHPIAQHGCLLINAAAASARDDDALRAVVRDYRAELAAAIAAGVDARHPTLGGPARANLASTCTAHVIAAMSLVRTDPAAALELLGSAIDAARG